MPILHFYLNPNQLTPEEKQELATTITAQYARVMPDFFVNIVFHDVCPPLTSLPVHSFPFL